MLFQFSRSPRATPIAASRSTGLAGMMQSFGAKPARSSLLSRLARNEVLGNLPFELDAVGAVLGDGFHPGESPGQFPTCNLSTTRGALTDPQTPA
ncbi:MAG: hypothetical protein ACLPKT_24010 [Methylocella sp.]